MPQSEYKARQIRAKTNEVIEYDHDEEKPGKPLHVLIPGGLIALATLGLIVLVIYLTWFEGRLQEPLGITLSLILAPFYVGGVFLFSYGYELYNIPRAIRLTAIIVFVTLAAVVILAVLALVLMAMGNSKGGFSSSRSKSSKTSTSSKTSSMGQVLTGIAGAGAKKTGGSSSSSGGSYSGGHVHRSGPIFIGGNPGRVETREVTKEVIKEVPKEPMPITCPFCERSYIPVEHKYVCPSCGAATPKELIEESQLPKNAE